MPKWAKWLWVAVAVDMLVWLLYAGIAWHEHGVQDCQNAYSARVATLADADRAAWHKIGADFSAAEDVNHAAATDHLQAAVERLNDGVLKGHEIPKDSTIKAISKALNDQLTRDLAVEKRANDALGEYRDNNNPKELCS